MSMGMDLAVMAPSEKRRLLRRILKSHAAKSRMCYAPSAGQRALWLIHQISPDCAGYNMSLAARIQSGVDIPALQNSFQALVDRHAILRTTYASQGGKLVQVVHERSKAHFEETDASGWTPGVLNSRLVAVANQRFNLENGPVCRVHLFSRGADEHFLLITIHHIAGDGTSIQILLKDLSKLYAAQRSGVPADLPPTGRPYTDFVRWQADLLEGPGGKRLWAYWKKKLSGCESRLNLPLDRPRPPVQTFCGAKLPFCLSPQLTRKLKDLAKQEGATLYAVLLAGFQLLLHRYSAQKDICIGSPLAGRTRPEFRETCGYYANPVVMRTDFSGDPTFTTLLGKVRRTVLEALEHQDFPFPVLVERLNPQRDADSSPLFQVLFAFEKGEHGLSLFGSGQAGARLALGELVLESIDLDLSNVQFDLTLVMEETGDALSGAFQYNADLFDKETICRMTGHLQTLLEGLLVGPGRRISEIPILTQAERQQSLTEWNKTELNSPRSNECVLHHLEKQADEHPEQCALIFGSRRFSYGELNARANDVARQLITLGVGPGDLVGVCMRRSLEMVVGLLGALKAGGAYLPLDPAYPAERLHFMLDDAQPRVLLTQKPLISGLPKHKARIVCLDFDKENDDSHLIRVENPDLIVTPQDLAYVIYTSGSTGKPKGVAVEHRSLINLVQAQIGAFGLDRNSRVLQFASFSFDASVSEIFTTLLSGGTLYLAEQEELLPGPDLVRTLRKSSITTVTLPPSVLEILDPDSLPSLKTVISAGEACSASIVERWSKGRTFINAYGPTEATVCSTLTRCVPCTRPPSIGRAIEHTRIYILDECLQPVPVGVPGEIYIGGVGVARGYINRPELTNEKFISDAFSETKGARLYKSGDLARRRSNGDIEYIGRIDRQVKIRGYRIELQEIEEVLRRHPSVGRVAVVACMNGRSENRLVAYVTASIGVSTSTQVSASGTVELRAFAGKNLPSYMVPSAFVFLSSLPLTQNGKVDEHALPSPRAELLEARENSVRPQGLLEIQLASIWEEILNVRSVGSNDDFFKLGGDSLLAFNLSATIKNQLGYNIPSSDIFQRPRLSQMAALLGRVCEEETSALVRIQSSGDRQPFFCVHPTSGTVQCYHELARALGSEQPFYGLQSIDKVCDYGSQGIEEMSSAYLAAIRTVQPHGPYVLGGWSLGSAVAAEMCHQLEVQGEKGHKLVLFDPYAIQGQNVCEVAEQEAQLFRLWLKDLTCRWGLPNIPGAGSADATLEERMAIVLQGAQRAGLLSSEAEVSEFHRLTRICSTNLDALRAYRLSVLKSSVIIFQSEQTSLGMRQQQQKLWAQATDSSPQTFLAGGDHYSMLMQPHVDDLARDFHRVL